MNAAVHHDEERVTDVLRRVAAGDPDDLVTVRSLFEAFGERSFGFLLLIFSLPNCVPAPPGLGSILGLPVLMIAAQMVLGWPTPWLPRRVLDKKMRRETLQKVLSMAEPKLRRVERLCRPRGNLVSSTTAERLIGLFIMLLSLCVLLPFPLTNMVPAMATVVISVALIEKDSVVLGLGVAIGLGGIAITASVLAALAGAIWAAFGLAS
ncbi:exopolysaccharide biosynthesis protein [Terrihabitans rhizophilus]|uniref:Exopolysaccharide biosynthesis protein n=1 Tax=Terrihabitans rhizophilus TaxID=3092662 RepID=A0ABU4RPF0_9HYPH|nr:exopolysaccharide biosynthesis protein [Terrihabitans sp. PJ23]MDX6806719.1 exopolysaccharide biosynthesis protein [Terrihabitans sp. PJ23]